MSAPAQAPRPTVRERMQVAAEIGLARRVMREMGYSQADVEDEVERIRRRHGASR